MRYIEIFFKMKWLFKVDIVFTKKNISKNVFRLWRKLFIHNPPRQESIKNLLDQQKRNL